MMFEIVVKATALFALGLLVPVLGRRASAAARHLLLACVAAGVLALPIASWIAPGWAVVVRPAAAAPFEPIADAAVAAAAAPLPPVAVVEEVSGSASGSAAIAGANPVLAVYALGVIAIVCAALAQQWQVRRVARRAAVMQDPVWTRLVEDAAAAMRVVRPVRLLRSREHNVPFVFGVRRAAIVMPAIADTWSGDRRRAVLRHELAHVVRLDCLTRWLVLAACAVYWFHPAAWWLARRLRIEAELACDDRVIAAGTDAREYAAHLLEIAYSLGGSRAPALAIAMARPRQLEGRMLAALDGARSRRIPRRGFQCAAAASAAAIVVALGGARAVTAGVSTLHVGDSGPALFETREESSAPVQDVPGTWEIRPSRTDGMVHLRMVEANSSSGSSVPIAQFEGLTAQRLEGAGGPIQFRLRRDAGTFTFEGVIRRGVGGGTFSFTADASFPNELAKRGFARPSAREQYELARHDVGYAFLDELTRQGYAKPATGELVRAGQHGVSTVYLREMGALGYRLGTLDPLITLRDHGVTPDYVRALAELGYKGLSADEVREARDHGVSADFVRMMRDAGYGSQPLDALINARDHGVSAEFVRGLAAEGFRNLPLAELIRVRDHGVSPEYVRDLRQLGYDLPIADFVTARDHGVSVDYARELAALGYPRLAMATLIRMRDHGVSVDYVRGLRALGYDQLAPDDLIYLRDHGLSLERIKAANERAGSRLPLDLLRALARGRFP